MRCAHGSQQPILHFHALQMHPLPLPFCAKLIAFIEGDPSRKLPRPRVVVPSSNQMLIHYGVLSQMIFQSRSFIEFQSSYKVLNFRKRSTTVRLLGFEP